MTDFDLKYSSLRKGIIEREFEKLNDMQKRAVFKTQGPLLLLAGAGSGKTTVLINRIINLLRFGEGYECETAPSWATEEDLRKLAMLLADENALPDSELVHLCAVNPPKPYEIIAITFTNKAAGELKERLLVACGEQAHDIWAQTFHSACTRILRRDIEKLGYSKNFTIYDDDDKKKLMSAILKDFNFDEKKFDVKGIASEIAHAKDSLITSKEYEEGCGNDYYKKTIARVFFEYEKRMRAGSALDFDDIIVKTVELLQGFPEVREHYQRKFKYVLVDEYQDTNHAQYVLCSMLADGYHNFCVVGDDDQSIYKFRGATITNILEFEQQNKNAVTIRLEQNYRSTVNILSAANDVISVNSMRKGKTLWTENEDGSKIQIFIAETQDDECQYISKQILEQFSSGVKLKNFTVLYRNHALSNSLEVAFKRNSIPYRIVSGLRFFDRMEVKDMLAYLWVINNPNDAVRLRRIINNPSRKIGPKAIETVDYLAQQKEMSVFEIAQNAESYAELTKCASVLMSFAEMINSIIAKKNTIPLMDLYDEILEKSGYLASLKSQNNKEAEDRIENVMELKSNIAEYCAKNDNATLEGFMEEISLFADIDRYDQEADAVTMMTMHSAKGLEFDTVFLCGAEEGIFPSYRSMENESEVEEERRLCYVAMTRAKKHLHVTCAKRRMLYGQTSYAKPSRFLEEIPEQYTEKVAAIPPRVPQSMARQKPVPKQIITDVSVMGRPESRGAAQNFNPGEHIQHKAFGAGTITSATPMGGDVLLEISFEKLGNKMMMAKTASQFITK